MLPPLQRFTLFPYTTLFRSSHEKSAQRRRSNAIWPEAQRSGRQAGSPESSRCRRMEKTQGKKHRARRGSLRTARSEEHTSELQSRRDIVCRLLLEKKNYSID